MPTVQTVQVGGAPQAQALNMPAEYDGMIKTTEYLLALLQKQYADECENFNRFQAKCVEALAMADQVIASRHGDANAHKQLSERRANYVANFVAMQEKFVAGLGTLEKAIGELGEGLHHLIGMAQGRPAPAAQKKDAERAAPQPNTVEESAPPAVQSQVAEVVEANGQRTIFQDGQPVLVVEPSPGAVPNGAVVPQGGNGTIVS